MISEKHENTDPPGVHPAVWSCEEGHSGVVDVVNAFQKLRETDERTALR